MKIDEKRVEMKKLKPCPVCKSQADTAYNTRFNYQAFCTNDECFMSTIIMHDKTTEEEAIEAWNKIASLEEVRHGHWINAYMFDDKWYHTCSNCNTESVETFFDFYCSYCGAKMEFEKVQK